MNVKKTKTGFQYRINQSLYIKIRQLEKHR